MGKLDLTVLAALGLVVWGGVKTLPTIIALVSPRRIRCWFADSLTKDAAISRSEPLKGRLQELAALGFSLLGVKNEKMPLWGRTVLEVATTSQETNTFASIVLTENGEPFTVYFFTPFLENGLVFTRQQTTLPQLESRDTSVKNIPSQLLSDLFRSHCDRVEAFRQEGFYPLAAVSQDSRIEATYKFYASAYAKKTLAYSAFLACLPSLVLALLLLYGNHKF